MSIDWKLEVALGATRAAHGSFHRGPHTKRHSERGKKGGYLVKLGVTGAKVMRFLTGVRVSVGEFCARVRTRSVMKGPLCRWSLGVRS